MKLADPLSATMFPVCAPSQRFPRQQTRTTLYLLMKEQRTSSYGAQLIMHLRPTVWPQGRRGLEGVAEHLEVMCRGGVVPPTQR